MKKNVIGAIVILAGVALVAGCATVKRSEFQSLENRVQTLESRNQGLEATSSAIVSTGESMTVKTESMVAPEMMTKKQIQQALKNAGYYDGSVDGKIGPKTRAAIMEFQKNAGLKADGIAGRQTKEKLAKYL